MASEMDRAGTRAAGWALVAAAASTMLFMAHHPTSAADGAFNQGVHAVLIALTGVSAYGFLHWSRLRGLERPGVAAALIAYGIALFGHIGAALMSGFVITALAHDGRAGVEAHILASHIHQALALLGALAASAAYALWSIDMIGRGRGAERAVGLAGLAAGIVPAVLLITGGLKMDLAGATIVYGAQMAWMAALGLLMLGGSRPDRPAVGGG